MIGSGWFRQMCLLPSGVDRCAYYRGGFDRCAYSRVDRCANYRGGGFDRCAYSRVVSTDVPTTEVVVSTDVPTPALTEVPTTEVVVSTDVPTTEGRWHHECKMRRYNRVVVCGDCPDR